MNEDERIAELEAENAALRARVETLTQRVHELRLSPWQGRAHTKMSSSEWLRRSLQRAPRRASVQQAPLQPLQPLQIATIHLEREWRLACLARPFDVYIDFVRVSGILVNERQTFEVAPGFHDLHLEIDWCSSPHVTIQLEAGEEITLICNVANLPEAMIAMIFDPVNLIGLYADAEPAD